jgi:hypothetical protein
MEYSYNAGTGGYDLKSYFDGAFPALISGNNQTAAGLTVLNQFQTNDLLIGKDWKGYIDAVRVYNTTMNGVVP